MTRILLGFIFLANALLSDCLAVGRSGEEVYAQTCATCHDNPTARTPTKQVISELEPSRIVQSLETGSMRIVGTFSMSGPERIRVAEYLTNKKYDANWASNTSNQCEANNWQPKTALNEAQWNGWGNGLENQRLQTAAAAGIDSSNVSGLELAWAFAFPGETYVESQPTIVGNRLFVGSPNGLVYALDAVTGCTYWTFQAGAAVKAPVTLGALSNGELSVFFGDQAGKVYSLNASDGSLRWSEQADDHPSARVTGGVQIYKNKLFVPMASLEEAMAMDPNYLCCIFRGSVITYDIESGKRLWKTYTIAQEPNQPSKDTHGKAMTGPSGASVWSAVTIDPERNALYIGTGDNYSNPASGTSDAILGLDMDSGKILWSYQGLAGDAWTVGCMAVPQINCPEEEGPDVDMGASPILTTTSTGRDVLIATQKSGDAHVIDPSNSGELIWRNKFAEGGVQGGFQWGQTTDGETLFAAISDTRWVSESSIGADAEFDPSKGGGLVAVDVETGELRWKAEPAKCDGRPRCSPSQSAAVSLIGDLVFSAAQNGEMFAYHKDSGEILWRFDSYRDFDTINGARGRGGAIDQAGAVAVNGMLYFNSGYSKFAGNPGNVLLAFRLAKE